MGSSPKTPAATASEARRLPGYSLGSLGLAFLMLSEEAKRLPAIQTVTAGESAMTLSPAVSLALIVIFAALAFAFRTRLDELAVPDAAVVGLAALQALALLCSWQAPALGYGALAEPAERAYEAMYLIGLFLWVREFYRQGALAAVSLVGGSITVAAMICGFAALMRAEAAAGAFGLLPLLSGVCLVLYRRAVRRGQNGRTPGTPRPAALVAAAQGEARRITLLASMAATMLCYAFLFGYVHLQWVGFQDGGARSFAMQLGIACGSLAAGLVVLLFARYLWSGFNLKLYLFGLVPVTVVALWLTSFVQETWVVFYLMLLNFAQKSVTFFIVALPLLGVAKRSACMPWVVICLSFELGKIISGAAMDEGLLDVYNRLSFAAVLVLFVCCGAIMLLDTSRSGGKAAESEPDEASLEAPKRGRFKRACWDLAIEHQITAREYDALVLLARGRTAAYIANDMVIAPSTAKVYIRNVYAKLGVHSQQDLITLVEERIDAMRDDEEAPAD